MQILVLTGGIGAGKSTASDYFRSCGAVVLDFDAIASDVLRRDSHVLDRVAEAFGEEVLLADGSLDRAALARAAFASPETARRLNQIVHPAVAREVGPALADIRLMRNQPDVVVLEVPLLVEAPVFAELADHVLAVVAPEDVRIARVVARGMAESDARRRLRVQATDAERAEMADTVIVNGGSLEAFLASLADFWGSTFGACAGR